MQIQFFYLYSCKHVIKFIRDAKIVWLLCKTLFAYGLELNRDMKKALPQLVKDIIRPISELSLLPFYLHSHFKNYAISPIPISIPHHRPPIHMQQPIHIPHHTHLTHPSFICLIPKCIYIIDGRGDPSSLLKNHPPFSPNPQQFWYYQLPLKSILTRKNFRNS